MKAEIISTIIWAPALLSLGFFFSQTAISISKRNKQVFFSYFGLVIVFLLFDKIVSSLFILFLNILKMELMEMETKNKTTKLITHNGSFHTDDIFAAATLSLMLEKRVKILK